ncbi:MAG TPA: YIP1 family protein [Methanocella sp.]|nr:YIP1 family protein [Methanocella sp.]
MSFVDRIIGVFANPDKTMGDIADKPHIQEALLIVGVYAVLGLVSSYVSSSHITFVYSIAGSSQSRLQTIQTISVIIRFIDGFIAPLILWLVITGILHGFAMLFGGKGKYYPQMLTALGYTDVIKIIAIIITILLYTQLPNVTVDITSTNTFAIISSVSATAITQSIYHKAGSIIMLLGVIASSLLGVFAIKNGEKLTLTKSAIVVGVPLLIYLIIELFSHGII